MLENNTIFFGKDNKQNRRQHLKLLAVLALGQVLGAGVLNACASKDNSPRPDINKDTSERIRALMGLSESMTHEQIMDLIYSKTAVDTGWFRQFSQWSFDFVNLDEDKYIVTIDPDGEPRFTMQTKNNFREFKFYAANPEKKIEVESGKHKLVVISSLASEGRLSQHKNTFKQFLDDFTKGIDIPMTLYFLVSPKLDAIETIARKDNSILNFGVASDTSGRTLAVHLAKSPRKDEATKPDRIIVGISLPTIYNMALNRTTSSGDKGRQRKAIINEIIGSTANEWANVGNAGVTKNRHATISVNYYTTKLISFPGTKIVLTIFLPDK
ncbi:hypothetical protein HY030_03265 [Candidatus Gottesmanbacteria bacterium]|nr:hypothetical protein [Candidatus Gottesmanbacteria bacterium]